jgi:hypothetical protein
MHGGFASIVQFLVSLLTRLTEEAQMKLVRFEDMNGRETFVNPDRVNHVSDYGSGTTEINFGDKQASVFVATEVSVVASTLLKAVTAS